MVKYLEPMSSKGAKGRKEEAARDRRRDRWELHVKGINQIITEVLSSNLGGSCLVWFGFAFLADGVICRMASEPHCFHMKTNFWLNLFISDL